MKINDLIDRLHTLQGELPVDEIIIETPEGDVCPIAKVKYNAYTGFVHLTYEEPED